MPSTIGTRQKHAEGMGHHARRPPPLPPPQQLPCTRAPRRLESREAGRHAKKCGEDRADTDTFLRPRHNLWKDPHYDTKFLGASGSRENDGYAVHSGLQH